jgi:hypothetical protein
MPLSARRWFADDARCARSIARGAVMESGPSSTLVRRSKATAVIHKELRGMSETQRYCAKRAVCANLMEGKPCQAKFDILPPPRNGRERREKASSATAADTTIKVCSRSHHLQKNHSSALRARRHGKRIADRRRRVRYADRQNSSHRRPAGGTKQKRTGQLYRASCEFDSRG